MNELAEVLRALTPAAGVWSIVGLLILTLIKGWPKLRELQIHEDGEFRTDLITEIRHLRKDVAAERKSCDEKLAEQERRYSAQIASLEQQVKGLERQLYQLQYSLRRMADSGHSAMGDILNQAFPLPDDIAGLVKKLDDLP